MGGENSTPGGQDLDTPLEPNADQSFSDRAMNKTVISGKKDGDDGNKSRQSGKNDTGSASGNKKNTAAGAANYLGLQIGQANDTSIAHLDDKTLNELLMTFYNRLVADRDTIMKKNYAREFNTKLPDGYDIIVNILLKDEKEQAQAGQ